MDAGRDARGPGCGSAESVEEGHGAGGDVRWFVSTFQDDHYWPSEGAQAFANAGVVWCVEFEASPTVAGKGIEPLRDNQVRGIELRQAVERTVKCVGVIAPTRTDGQWLVVGCAFAGPRSRLICKA